ncbi:MAG: GTP 3',8-cyclase MoaA [Flammeovirgaceae bacterium]
MFLLDKWGRVHDYLRLSLTDKCNLRCTYCLPKDPRFFPNQKLLTKDELVQLATLFVEAFGIKKIRFTGGEPLLRKDAGEIIQEIAKLPVKLNITTNGIFLDRYLDLFQEIGLTSLNISLDTLDRAKFNQITLRDEYDKVMTNIDLALSKGFRIKVNAVAIKGFNDQEVVDFVAWTKVLPIHVRFIEFMPFNGNEWQWEKVVPYQELLQQVEALHPVEKLNDAPTSTTKSYRVKGYAGTFAFITTVSQPFCQGCNRIRLTADGKLRNCLFARGEFDLKTPLREGKDVKALIQEAILAKHKERGGLPEEWFDESFIKDLSDRSMTAIGG